jgi:Activator of Hsp90 ATPase homolog 1-like protein
MSTQAAEKAIASSIVVAAPIERAFSVFTKAASASSRQSTTCSRSRSARRCSSRASAATCTTRPRRQRMSLGARARLRAAAPGPFSWDISPQWQIESDPAKTSEVEVRFIAETSDRTRVELEHRNLERHGEGWEGVRESVGGEEGWPLYLQRFAALLAED